MKLSAALISLAVAAVVTDAAAVHGDDFAATNQDPHVYPGPEVPMRLSDAISAWSWVTNKVAQALRLPCEHGAGHKADKAGRPARPHHKADKPHHKADKPNHPADKPNDQADKPNDPVDQADKSSQAHPAHPVGFNQFKNTDQHILSGQLQQILAQKGQVGYLQAKKIVQAVAQQVGESVDSIPGAAYSAWAQVLSEYPEKIEDLVQATMRSFQRPKLPSLKRPDSTWLHVLKDERFPQHTLKVKSPNSLNVDTVKQYSGYLDVDEASKHFFYWFFESRNDPETDPIVLWLNGGPGCSSLTGQFFELGPASINEDARPELNPFSWNNNASIIFLDQPVNTGFSYSDDSVSDTVTASKDVFAFLELFFKQFPEYKKLDLHIAGESYAGHYIPVFASEILGHTHKSFNLTSVLIGNGLTDPLKQYDMYEPMACGQGGEDPVLSDTECQKMVDAQPTCDQLIEKCYTSPSRLSCVPATVYCNNAMMKAYQSTGRNVYDIRVMCGSNPLCYDGLDYIDTYLNLPEVQSALGAEVQPYKSCNMDVNLNFLLTGDWMRPYYESVSLLLDKDIPVLVYAGDKDFICNWLGNMEWTRKLQWKGAQGFAKAPMTSWKMHGSEVGQAINHEHFTFLRVYGAGHMVPYDQPQSSLDMFNRWLSGDRFGN